MIDKMLFIEIKPNVVISYGVERQRELEKRLNNITKKRTKNKKKNK